MLTAIAGKDYEQMGGGVNYYVRGQSLKFTLQGQRVFPRNNATRPANEFTLQLQMFYF